ncbi:hypothetical protein HOP50_01g00990 [Chloropicon primus]|nr:hypothetical protein HOP50_01g00990 [Chloropicon primus]
MTGREQASPGVADRYASEQEDESSTSDGVYLTPHGSPTTNKSYSDIHLGYKGGPSRSSSYAEAVEDESDIANSLLERRHTSYRSALNGSALSPGDPIDPEGKPFQLKMLEVNNLEGGGEDGEPKTPPARNNEQFVSPKSLSMSPNVKALDRSAQKNPSEASKRRKHLLEYTANLWDILGSVCEHSTLLSGELAGTTDRINKLKGMNEELGALEAQMEALQSIYTFESKAYLKKLRRLESEVVLHPASNPESDSSLGQTAIDRSFSRSVCKILYDDKKGKGMFQLVSAKLEGEK